MSLGRENKMGTGLPVSRGGAYLDPPKKMGRNNGQMARQKAKKLKQVILLHVLCIQLRRGFRNDKRSRFRGQGAQGIVVQTECRNSGRPLDPKA